jgi:hypothetical protein
LKAAYRGGCRACQNLPRGDAMVRRRGCATLRCHSSWPKESVMPQINDLSRSLTVFEQDRTLVVVCRGQFVELAGRWRSAWRRASTDEETRSRQGRLVGSPLALEGRSSPAVPVAASNPPPARPRKRITARDSRESPTRIRKKIDPTPHNSGKSVRRNSHDHPYPSGASGYFTDD